MEAREQTRRLLLASRTPSSACLPATRSSLPSPSTTLVRPLFHTGFQRRCHLEKPLLSGALLPFKIAVSATSQSTRRITCSTVTPAGTLVPSGACGR